ncbi:MAG TPA: hypothetical protein VFC79_05930 [Tissierellaceae bacterium]|nr:hypothetical protein [Tissierellaceae bacterium]
MQVYDVMISPLIVGIVEIFKQLGMPKQFSPVLSVVLGMILGVFYISPDDILKGLLLGTSLGLGAVGLYSGTKNTKESFED